MKYLKYAMFFIAMFAIVGCFDEGRVPSLVTAVDVPEPPPNCPILRVFYLEARDRPASDYEQKVRRIDELVKDVQRFYADEMARLRADDVWN